ncbi:unnamed protein product [Urochloa humidicola]
MMLPYISHVLMEDDIDEKISDHPGLLQVQQPFAQILSSHSFGINTDNAASSVAESAVNPALSKGTDVVRAFLKGMDEANMLLPKDNGVRRDELVNQVVNESSNKSGVKKRYNSDEHQEGKVRRTRKSIMMIKELYGICTRDELLDDMMLRGHETCIRGIEKLCIAMANEVEKNSRKGVRKAIRNVLDIHTLLILCAQAVATGDHLRARELLKQIKQHASETRDATQRLAQCFAKGLEARLVGMGCQFGQLLMAE